jgi:hypothetical protein
VEESVATTLKALAKQPSEAAADRFRQVMITGILRLNRVVAS